MPHLTEFEKLAVQRIAKRVDFREAVRNPESLAFDTLNPSGLNERGEALPIVEMSFLRSASEKLGLTWPITSYDWPHELRKRLEIGDVNLQPLPPPESDVVVSRDIARARAARDGV